MMIDLNDKVALVTGAASAGGLGFATAKKMAEQGARIFLTDIDETSVLERAEDLQKMGFEARAMAHDVTDEAAWKDVMGSVINTYGKLDILVNNAGIAVLGMIKDITKADWDKQLKVNLDSVYLGCKAGLDQMSQQGNGGSIINLSSVAGLIGVPGTAAYAASKGGVRLFTKSIALEYAAENIRVNSVHPGMIWTDMQKVAIADNKEQYDLITAAIPMKRMGEPEDIGSMIAFLASDDAKYITGAEFVVDGGMVAQ
ncbi:glucose 1-dehydrogenase [Emcibacter sp.]|uniref:SDR family NAD(P)-dependent oxidoreductase n=1 Tax=Emcibacter sp. TaxID=1979954 RepID=UPI002AA5F7C6|nr:glucose 1-dehydrogenase [Emcibacter sp.]